MNLSRIDAFFEKNFFLKFDQHQKTSKLLWPPRTEASTVGKDIELDSVGRQFEPYPYRRMRLHAGGCCSQTVVVLKLRRTPAFFRNPTLQEYATPNWPRFLASLKLFLSAVVILRATCSCMNIFLDYGWRRFFGLLFHSLGFGLKMFF